MSDNDYLENTGPEAVPIGTYPAVLKSCDDQETKYGTRRKWTFVLLDPSDHTTEREVSKFTSLSTNEQSKGGEIIVALRGAPLGHGERIERSDLFGLPCQLIVGVNDGGWNTVQAVMRPRAAKQAAAMQTPTSQDPGYLEYQAWKAHQAAPDVLPPALDDIPF